MAKGRWLWTLTYEVHGEPRRHGSLVVAARYGALDPDLLAEFKEAVAKRENTTTDKVMITKAESGGAVRIVFV